VARLAHRSPPTANLAVEGITDRPNRESQTARKPACTAGFLAKSITCSGQIIAIDQSLPNSSRTTKETSVCIVDDAGKIVREVRVASEPEALLQVLTNTIYRFKRVGLEAGPLSQWLYSVLAEAGFPVICVETRHMRAVLNR